VYPTAGEERFSDVRGATLGLPASGASPTFDSDSQLYHVEGQYEWSFPVADVSVGANYRRFRLTSNGTLFSDGENASPLQPDGTRDVRDEIINEEAGGYLRVQRGFFDDRWKLSAVGRVDAFKNFDTRFSPRVTSVVTLGENREHNFRASVSQAYRSPAQLDQYIYLDIGPILLQGNVDGGFSGLDPFASKPLPQQLADGEQFRIAPLELEKMTSVEFGYKAVLFERVLADLSYYHSWYTDFIGTRRFVGKEDGTEITPADFSPGAVAPARLMQVWLNADEEVRTQGIGVSLEVPVVDALTLTGNYTWSSITEGEAALKERINLGFNTPEHKFNVGARGEVFDHFTYNTNLRWVDSYLYEMPFSEGEIESHYTVDAQLGYTIPQFRSTIQIGGTNLTDQDNVTAFGAAPMGRLLYAGISIRY
jgi:outer membrane receptor for ferrienterochelin and colicin